MHVVIEGDVVDFHAEFLLHKSVFRINLQPFHARFTAFLLLARFILRIFLVVKNSSLIYFHSLSYEVAVLVEHQKCDDLVNCIDDTKHTTKRGDVCEDIGLVFTNYIVFVHDEIQSYGGKFSFGVNLSLFNSILVLDLITMVAFSHGPKIIQEPLFNNVHIKVYFD